MGKKPTLGEEVDITPPGGSIQVSLGDEVDIAEPTPVVPGKPQAPLQNMGSPSGLDAGLGTSIAGSGPSQTLRPFKGVDTALDREPELIPSEKIGSVRSKPDYGVKPLTTKQKDDLNRTINTYRQDFTPQANLARTEAMNALKADEDVQKRPQVYDPQHPDYAKYHGTEAYYDLMYGDLDEAGTLKKQKQVEQEAEVTKKEFESLKQESEIFDSLNSELLRMSVAGQDNTPEYQTIVDQYNSTLSGMQEKLPALQDMETSLNRESALLARKQFEIANGKGSWGGAMWNSVVDGIASMNKEVFGSVLPDLFIELEGWDAEKTAMYGFEGAGGKDKMKRLVKGVIKGDIQEGYDEVKSSGTTQEFANKIKKEHPILGEGILGLAKSIPAMATPYMGGILLQTMDSMEEEMSGEEWNDVGEWEKKGISVVGGGIAMTLERLGFRNLASGSPFVKRILANVISKTPTGATAGTIQRILDAETISAAKNFTVRMVAGGLAEAETGGLQEIADISLKEIYNDVKGRDLFETPDTASGVLKQVLLAAAQEAVGGKIMSVPGALSVAMGTKGAIRKMEATQYDYMEKLLADPKFAESWLLHAEQKVKEGVMTQAELDKARDDWDTAREVSQKIPDGMDPEKRKEAFDLLLQRDELNKKDKTLTGTQRAAIDEKLAALVGVKKEDGDSKPATDTVSEGVQTDNIPSAEPRQVDTDTPVVEEPITSSDGLVANTTPTQEEIQAPPSVQDEVQGGVEGQKLTQTNAPEVDPELDTLLDVKRQDLPKQEGGQAASSTPRMSTDKATTLLKKVVPGVKVITHKDQPSLSRAYARNSGRNTLKSETATTKGFYDTARKEIHIGPFASETTLAHEVMHPLFRAAMAERPASVKALYDELLKDPDLATYIEHGNRPGYKKQGEAMVMEEAIVQFMAAAYEGKLDEKFKNNKNLLQRVRDFIKDILAKLGLRKSEIDFSNIENLKQMAGLIHEAARTGGVATAKGVANESGIVDDAFGGEETPTTPIGDTKTVTVDGKERTVFNSNGKPIHPTVEGVRNFWRFYKGPKDSEGRPLVVYHATHSNIDAFKRTKGAHIGFHFGDIDAARSRLEMTTGERMSESDKQEFKRLEEKYQEARSRAGDYEETFRGRRRQPTNEEQSAILDRIKNGESISTVLEEYEYKPTQDELTALSELKAAANRAYPGRAFASGANIGAYYISTGKLLRLPDAGNWASVKKIKGELPWESDAITMAELADEITSKGYGGIVYLNAVEYAGVPQDSYIVFSSTQIKSATGNYGSFDPREASILMARANSKEIAEAFKKKGYPKEAAQEYMERAGVDEAVVKEVLGAMGDQATEEEYTPRAVETEAERIKQYKEERDRSNMGPMGPVDASKMNDEQRSFVTGTKNAVVEAERAERMADPIYKEAQKTNEQTFAEAEAIAQANPLFASAVIRGLNDGTKTTVSEVEEALMLFEKIRLRNERARLTDIIDNKNTPENTMAEAVEQWSVLEDKINEVDLATRKSGTIWGRLGQFRQRMMNEDYSFEEMERKARVAKGDALTEGESKKIKEQADQIADLERKLSDARLRAEEGGAVKALEQEVKAMQEQVRSESGTRDFSPRVIRIAERMVADLDVAADAARARMRARLGQMSSGVDPAVLYDISVIGAAKLGHAALDFAKWSDAMISDLGKNVKPYLEKAWENAEKIWAEKESAVGASDRPGVKGVRRQKAEKGATLSDIKELVTGRIDEGFLPEEIQPLINKLALAFVRDGVTDRNDLVEKVHEVISEGYPDLTKPQTRDIISGYGKYKKLDKEPAKVVLRGLRGEMQQIGKIEDMMAKMPPKKTGMERRESTPEERRLTKEVNDLKRKGGFTVTDPEAQLKSALGAIKTRLRNEIIDIDNAIAKNLAIPRSKNKVRTDAELEALRSERDEAKVRYDAVFPKKALTQEQLLEAAEKSIDRSIALLEKNIKEGAPRPVVKEALSSPAIDAKRAKLEALRSERDELRELIDPGYAERTALKAYKKRALSRIAELKQRIADGDFSKKEQKQVSLDAEGKKIALDLNEVKKKFMHDLFMHNQRNKPRAKRIKDTILHVLNTSRALITSYDLSAAGRQGMLLAFAHPSLALRAGGKMLRSVKSEADYQNYWNDIQKRSNAELYRTAKLFLVDPNEYSLAKMEEAYMSRWASKVPGVGASQRAYTTYLNEIRADAFDMMVKNMGLVNTTQARAIANYINISTGRGNLAGASGAAISLNAAFFSPRLVVSRFEYLLGQPMYGGDSATRKAIAKEYAKTAIGAFAAVALYKAAKSLIGDEDDDDEEFFDPRSSSFLKMRIGEHTHVDMFAGLIQAMVLMSRVASGEKTTISGRVVPIRGDVPYGSDRTWDVFATFMRTKLSPPVSAFWNIASGGNVIGEDTSVVKEGLGMIAPMTVRDIYDAIKAEGVPTGTAIGILVVLGFGVQTYENDRKNNVASKLNWLGDHRSTEYENADIEDLLEKNQYPTPSLPDASKYEAFDSSIGKKRTFTDDEQRAFYRIRGEYIKDKLTNGMTKANAMTKEDFKKEMKKLLGNATTYSKKKVLSGDTGIEGDTPMEK